MKPLVLVGGGGHCKSVIDVVEMQNEYKIEGILDTKERVGDSVLGYTIIGTDKIIPELAQSDAWFFITVGQIGRPDLRIKIFETIGNYTDNLATIISPLAHVSKHAKILKGSVVMHYSVVNANAIVGNNCIINTKALVEHDAVIEKHCHIATGAIVNGGTMIREGSFVGSGAVTQEYVQTRPFAFIKAGSVFKGYPDA